MALEVAQIEDDTGEYDEMLRANKIEPPMMARIGTAESLPYDKQWQKHKQNKWRKEVLRYRTKRLMKIASDRE